MTVLPHGQQPDNEELRFNLVKWRLEQPVFKLKQYLMLVYLTCECLTPFDRPDKVHFRIEAFQSARTNKSNVSRTDETKLQLVGDGDLNSV